MEVPHKIDQFFAVKNRSGRFWQFWRENQNLHTADHTRTVHVHQPALTANDSR